jgi:predicted ATPase
VPSIGDFELPVQSPLTVLAGPNGAGKTTLLRAVWAALEPSEARSVVVGRRKLTSGSAQVDLTVAGDVETARVKFSAESIDTESETSVSVQHIDGSAFSLKYQPEFCAFESADELLNGVGVVDLDDKGLSEIGFILNRNYRSIKMYEVEFDVTVPFFEVTYGDDKYDSRTMGAGEMSALYMWWAIGRAARNSIILVEEPEAYLSSGCQDNLDMFLVKSIVSNGLVAIVSSHSPSFISPMPKESLIFLSRGEGGLAVLDDQPPQIVLKSLGIHPVLAAIVFVEDSMGRLLCRAILERFDVALSRQTHIDQRKGDGEVKAALKPMLEAKLPIQFVGLFDGDVRSSVDAMYESHAAFLPGDLPMETIFREMVRKQPAALSMEIKHENLFAVLAALEGIDLHDWYEELAKELGVSREQLFSTLFKIWISLPDNESAARQTYSDLAARIRRESIKQPEPSVAPHPESPAAQQPQPEPLAKPQQHSQPEPLSGAQPQ